MKVNLHTNFYNNSATKPVFKGEDKTSEGNTGKNELQLLDIKKDDETMDTFYNEGFDDGYDAGYKQAAKNGKYLNKLGLFVLGALSALNIGYTKLAIDNSNTNTAELSYKIAESNYDLNQRLDELEFDANLNDAAILSTIIDMFTELKEQQNAIKQQIEALPEDSEEAQALKDELKSIEEQYKILEEKYRDYMSEYNQKQRENEDKNTPDDRIIDSQTVLAEI